MNPIKCPCTGCDFTSEDGFETIEHVEAVHKKEVYPCHLCGGELYLDIMCHEILNHSHKKCYFCGNNFVSYNVMMDHLKTTHKVEIGLQPIMTPVAGQEQNLLEKLNQFLLSPKKQLIEKENIILGWDPDIQRPEFGFEKWIPKSQLKTFDRPKTYYHDRNLPYEQVNGAMIKAIGMEVGHICSARNHGQSLQDLKDSFSNANLCPQVANLNRGKLQSIDSHWDELVAVCAELYVLTLLVYDSTEPVKSLGGKAVYIPRFIMKVGFLVKEDVKAQCFLFENVKSIGLGLEGAIWGFRTTLSEIEMKSDFRIQPLRLTWDLNLNNLNEQEESNKDKSEESGSSRPPTAEDTSYHVRMKAEEWIRKNVVRKEGALLRIAFVYGLYKNQTDSSQFWLNCNSFGHSVRSVLGNVQSIKNQSYYYKDLQVTGAVDTWKPDQRDRSKEYGQNLTYPNRAKFAEKWIGQNVVKKDGSLIAISALYSTYEAAAKRQNKSTIMIGNFGSLIKNKFGIIKTIRRGSKGSVKKCYDGLTLLSSAAVQP